MRNSLLYCIIPPNLLFKDLRIIEMKKKKKKRGQNVLDSDDDNAEESTYRKKFKAKEKQKAGIRNKVV